MAASDDGGRKRKLFLNGKEEDGEPQSDSDPGSISAALNLGAAQVGCVRLFVAGAVSHVGKTTVCLGLLSALRKAGIPASELAYIKPATQCEAPDLLEAWCKAEGVLNISGEQAPLVFFSGFTRSFIMGEQGTSESWLQRIRDKVDELAEGRRVVIIDGVGFPGVGSCVGVDNADVAKACRAPVLMVCKSGVGGAIDSFSLNSSYFVSKGVPVLGALFNLAANDGFYSWDKCAESLKMWFAQGGKRERYFGVVPTAPELVGLREKVSETDEKQLLEFAQLNASHLASHVDLPGIFAAAAADPWCRSGHAGSQSRPQQPVVPQLKPSTAASREEVVASAKAAGSKGGG